jgi:hypothetical protein
VTAPDPTTLLTACPGCGRRVLEFPIQGGLRLDWPAVDRARNPHATWSLIDIGDHWLAGNGEGERGTGHELHAHQPPSAT